MSEFIGPPDKHKSHHTKILLFIIFLVVVGFLIITSFFGFALTGNVIENLAPGKNSTIDLRADLTVPDLKLEGEFGEVTIKGGSNSNLYIGNQKFYLGNSNNNFISFENFDGKIFLSGNSISGLNGKAEKVSVNGVPVESRNKGTLSINMDENFRYNFISVKKGVSIEELNYVTSGTIRVNNERNIFQVNGEKVNMKNFQGDLSIENNNFKLHGKVSRLDIKGEQGISITS